MGCDISQCIINIIFCEVSLPRKWLLQEVVVLEVLEVYLWLDEISVIEGDNIDNSLLKVIQPQILHIHP